MTKDQVLALFQSDISKEQAIELSAYGWWLDFSDEEAALMQFNQPLLCLPFDLFHEKFEKLMGRPVWTHEFASSNHDNLRDEMMTGRVATMKEIIDLIPAHKLILYKGGYLK